MISDASTLAETSVAEQLKALAWARNLTLLAALALLLSSLITGMTVVRSLAVSLKRLHAGTEIIGSGDLEHKLDLDDDNEIGQLSRAFNRMTTDLKAVTVSKLDLEREILERERIEEALRESEERYRTLFETMSEGFALDEIILDGNGHPVDLRYLMVNPAFERHTGLKAEDIVGRTTLELFPHAEADWFERCGEVVATGEPVHFDSRFGPLDRHFEVSVYRVDTRRFATVFQDITERKRTEGLLRRHRDELERQVKERTVDLSLTVETLREEAGRRALAEQALRERSEKLRALASELTLAEQRERQRLAQVLHDGLQQVLVGAKFRMSSLERIEDEALRKTARDVTALLSDSIEMSRSLTSELSPPILRDAGLVPALEWLARWMKDKHGLVVGLETRGEIAPIRHDLTILFFQATRELLFNVVKHAGVGAAVVELGHFNEHIHITVADQGVGFDPVQLGSLGQGFGLFSIRERIDLLGGSLEIDSHPGGGSRFTLVAPSLPPAKPTPDRRSGAPAAVPAERREAAAGTGKIRVVLVDDHTVMRQGLAGLLREEPDIAIVGEASDGESAVRLIREVRPEVVLMDISMPGMNGIEATRIIHAELSEIRVIGLSMFEEVEQAEAMRQAGAVDYLSKTGPSNAVIAAIRAAVAKEKAPSLG